MRKVGWLAAVGIALYAGSYTVVYLLRWQWNRALFMAMAFLAAEVAVATLVVLRRLDGAPARAPSAGRRAEDPVVADLRDARPTRRHFEWLSPTNGRFDVFITLLVAGGIVVSGLAWVVERIASATGSAGLERRLARRLAALAPPEELVVDDGELLAAELPYHPDPELRLLLAPLTTAPEEADEGDPWSG